MTTASLTERLSQIIRDVPDFPSPGILFKDITPLLASPELMRAAVSAMCEPFAAAEITHIVAVESRGFLFGMPMALELGIAFAPARKPGKLPWHTVRESYALEYRNDVLEMHEDALTIGMVGAGRPRVVVVDDVLATGGTAAATCRLVERLGGEVIGVSVLVELGFLGGRTKLAGRHITPVVTY